MYSEGLDEQARVLRCLKGWAVAGPDYDRKRDHDSHPVPDEAPDEVLEAKVLDLPSPPAVLLHDQELDAIEEGEVRRAAATAEAKAAAGKAETAAGPALPKPPGPAPKGKGKAAAGKAKPPAKAKAKAKAKAAALGSSSSSSSSSSASSSSSDSSSTSS